ncbi:hypothetical protein [Lysinibacillus sp. NPDC086135]|uniref:hypothetical protein n=1 Tax=Lysinibacillus sp. NPDC086135 TaxID=3364130 RepID=UPI0037F2BA45
MKYKLELKNGMSYNLSGAEIDIESISQLLNSPREVYLNFSGILVSSSLFSGLLPVFDEEQPEEVEEVKE